MVEPRTQNPDFKQRGIPLDAVYPIVYLDALVVKIREAGHVRNKAIYVAIGVNTEGNKEVWGCGQGRPKERSSSPGILPDGSASGACSIALNNAKPVPIC
jgi:hypothetical protein